jgi:hypothetical protein
MPDEYKKCRSGAPSGYTALKGSPPAAVVKIAKEMLKKPMGAQEKRTIDETEYLFQLEPHYHEPPAKPTGWHKGCSVYIKK